MLMSQKYLGKMHLDQRDHIMNPKNIKMVMKIKILYLLMNLVFQLTIKYHSKVNPDKDPPAKKPHTRRKWKYLISVYGL